MNKQSSTIYICVYIFTRALSTGFYSAICRSCLSQIKSEKSKEIVMLRIVMLFFGIVSGKSTTDVEKKWVIKARYSPHLWTYHYRYTAVISVPVCLNSPCVSWHSREAIVSQTIAHARSHTLKKCGRRKIPTKDSLGV